MGNLFHDELGQLKMTVLRMMNLSRAALQKSVRSVLERNDQLAEEVLASDREIDQLECELDKRNLRLLALEQPVARDLRFIVGCMRLTVDIERIGDEAATIADRALILHGRPPMEPGPLLEEFMSFTMAKYDDAVRAFSDLDNTLAEDICTRDQQAVNFFMKVFRDMANYMIKESRTVERAVQYSFIAHSLKRICDRSTNIAESVIFMDQGVSVKHVHATPSK